MAMATFSYPHGNSYLVAAVGLVLAIQSLPSLFILGISFLSYWCVDIAWSYCCVSSPTCNKIHNRIMSMYHQLDAYVTKHFLRDPRDFGYFIFVVATCIWYPLIFIAAAYRCYHYGLDWTTVVLYHWCRIGPSFRLLTHLHVFLHKEGHCPKGGFFKNFTRDDDSSCVDQESISSSNKPALSNSSSRDNHSSQQKWTKEQLFSYIPIASLFNHNIGQWFLGIFNGHIPGSYFISHNKIHHVHHNSLEDVHTTMDLDRTLWLSILIYMTRFALFWNNLTPMIYFMKRQDYRKVFHLVIGFVYYYFWTATCWYWMGFSFTYWFMIMPQIEAIYFVGTNAFIWHAFVDPKDPTNPHVNSITIVNSTDNVWGEDYHVIHHFNYRQIHWKDAHSHYEKNKELYRLGSVFKNCVEAQLLIWLLLGNFDAIAECWDEGEEFTITDGSENKQLTRNQFSHEEKVRILKERARFVVSNKSVDE
ncbi:hypothetical protein C9374_003663 [Naegleria lovaniensis]|uniref:Fatty acid desaturase domain-containing protein n=1 Tax=Naegleria lovaniensis TaxID=51637 RepID=A0AA88H0A6_NAELO|nr:uncharacterized protein C9374_003663 [Naegleria lovaniensis]KAG2393899.1 hypothetical protein C9374_003663 [Naegleria lovaniensis]